MPLRVILSYFVELTFSAFCLAAQVSPFKFQIVPAAAKQLGTSLSCSRTVSAQSPRFCFSGCRAMLCGVARPHFRSTAAPQCVSPQGYFDELSSSVAPAAPPKTRASMFPFLRSPARLGGPDDSCSHGFLSCHTGPPHRSGVGWHRAGGLRRHLPVIPTYCDSDVVFVFLFWRPYPTMVTKWLCNFLRC
jgi:hypothetical protein